MSSFKRAGLLVLFLFSALQIHLYAQLNQSVDFYRFVYYSPSPRINAMGMAGASLPTDDPYGFYYNPAQLGYFSQTNNLSYQLYPSSAKWEGQDVLNFRNSAINLGYNFKNLLGGINLSAGFGYIHSKLDYGTYTSEFYSDTSSTPIGTVKFNPYDEYDAYSIGVGINYNVQFSIGVTYKNILSEILYLYPYGTDELNAKGYSIDYGMLLTVPIVKLIEPKYKFDIMENIPAVPYLNFSIGYSRLNQGARPSFNVEPFVSLPLPRDTRLGYALSVGLNIKLNDKPFKLFEYDFTADAEEIMINAYQVNVHSNFPYTYYTYKDGLGDIGIGNILGLKGDDNVTIHKAHVFNLLESFTAMIGRFDGGEFRNEESNGIGMRLKGLLNLFKAYTGSETFNFIADHFDVQYYSSTINIENMKTKFESVNLSFYNFEF